MLVLSRKAGQSLRIGDDITVTLVSINDRQIKIGIDAPIEIEVHREEVYNRIHCTPDVALAKGKGKGKGKDNAKIER